MRTPKIYSTLFFFCCLLNSLAQKGWEASSAEEFSKAIMAMEQVITQNNSYSYQTDYSFYEELESTTPVLTESAQLICNEQGELYMEQFGQIIIQNKTINVTVDEASQSIVIKDALEDYTKRKTTADFSALQAKGSTIQKKTVQNKTIFYITFPEGFQYVGAEMTTGGAMGIEKYILYSRLTAFENSEGVMINAQPRMEVVFRNFIQGNQVKSIPMKRITDFLTLVNGAYVLNDSYKEFELIDLRSQP